MVFVPVLCARVSAAEPRKFESLHAAAKALDEAVVQGASYDRSGELARDFANELVAAGDKVENDEDRALLMLYARAGLAYGDGLSLWREKTKSPESNMLPASSASIAPLIERYRMPTVDDGRVDVDAGMRLIWAAAQTALRKAELLRDGRVQELVAMLDAEAQVEGAPAESAPPAATGSPQPTDASTRAAAEAAHQRAMIERIAAEFDAAERKAAARPAPYEASPGNWTCPRGYVVRRGKCLSDAEVARLPKVELGQ